MAASNRRAEARRDLPAETYVPSPEELTLEEFDEYIGLAREHLLLTQRFAALGDMKGVAYGFRHAVTYMKGARGCLEEIHRLRRNDRS